MRKWTLYSGLILFFIVAIILMNGSNLLGLSMFGIAERWQTRLDDIGHLILNEQWEEAIEEADDLEDDWRKVLPYIQFSVELEEYRFLEQDFIKLKNALSYRNSLESEKQRLLIQNSLTRLTD